MNAVEIEEEVSKLVERPFDPVEFPFQFLEAFGNKPATIKRLRDGHTNSSDLGGVLQRSNIHIAVAEQGNVSATLTALKASPATARAKAQFVLATDGQVIEAEDIESGETVACAFTDLPEYFGFFLSLAGISTVKQVRDSSFDIRATSRLNKLYIELLRENREWGTAERRPDMNHFMARLIFCFFAEDTDIFNGTGLFTSTVDQMSEKDGSNTHEVIAEIFRAMNTPIKDRQAVGIRPYANMFPYVNGGLFSGSLEVPRFTRIARAFLFQIGSLKWTQINPDIFGSMIQAVADDEERGALGMHYTSRPNILKVLDPLFLDSLREQLEEAGDNSRKLLNLRNRMARIRVFDPACGSGNFLVIAYKEMREIEAEINKRRDEQGRASDIPLTNFRGIELRDFPAEVARLALIIAEFQCDVLHRGQKLALAEFLPLNAENWITCGNALKLDWVSICPPTGTGVRLIGDDLFETPLDQAQIDFENEGGETYICGNPPYLGSTWQSQDQKSEIKALVNGRMSAPGFLDYVAGWFLKAAALIQTTGAEAAFVSTNSICQGQMVPLFWPIIFKSGCEIAFAHTSFKWNNLASNNAGVSVVIVGLRQKGTKPRRLYEEASDGTISVREADKLSPYLVLGTDVSINKESKPISLLPEMEFGNKPSDGGNLLLDYHSFSALNMSPDDKNKFIRRIMGSDEFINGKPRFCVWIMDSDLREAEQIPELKSRIDNVRALRLASRDKGANALARRAHQLKLMRIGNRQTIIVPGVSSERRPYLTAGIVDEFTTLTNAAFGIYDGDLWSFSIVSSKLHLVWIQTVCGQLETRLRYSNTMGWNTFPLPTLTDKNKEDLTRCAEDILLAREAHFPATIAELYDPENMPDDLREAHERNDEVLERIYIGRRFKNDTERLEKLFELYTKMTARAGAAKKRKVGTSA